MNRKADAMARTVEREFFGGWIRLHILHHAGQARVFGAGLTEELKRHGYSISPGTLYPILHQLERNGYLQSRQQVVAGRLRRSYVATAAGKLALRLSRPRIRALVRELFGEEASRRQDMHASKRKTRTYETATIASQEQGDQMRRDRWISAGTGVVLAATLALATSPTYAGPPFRTDDPEAVEYRHAELYVFGQETLTHDGRSGFLPALEFNYGIYPNVQLHLVTPWAFNKPSGGGTTHGYGDTELGVKWQFNEESETLPMIGVFPLLEVPTGNSDKGLGNGHSQIFLPVWLQKKWGKFQTYGGGGYWINNGLDNRNYWFAGLQVQYEFSEHVTLGAEIFHTTSQVVDQDSSTGFNAGGYYNFDEHNHFLFSAGKGLHNASETNRFSAYIGYQYTL